MNQINKTLRDMRDRVSEEIDDADAINLGIWTLAFNDLWDKETNIEICIWDELEGVSSA